MRQCKKDIEVKLEDGSLVEAVLKVRECVDYLDDTETAHSFIESWSVEHDEELDEDQQAEFDEKIEEIVFQEKWDFDNASEVDEDEEVAEDEDLF